MKEEASRCVDAWNSILVREGLAGMCEAKPAGVFYNPGYNKRNRAKFPPVLVIPFVYWASPDASTPGFEGVKYLVSDEILGGNEFRKFAMKEPVSVLRKLTKRARAHFNTNEGRTVNCLIANPHTPESDWFTDLELDWSWKDTYEGKNIFLKYETSNGLKVCFAWIMDTSRVPNEYLQAQDREDVRWGTSGYNKEFWNPRKKVIFPKRDDVEYTPICGIQTIKKVNKQVIKDTILLSTYSYNGEDYLYCEPMGNQNVPIYSIEAVAHDNDTFLRDEHAVWDKLSWLSDYHMNATIRYCSPYIRGCMWDFLTKIDRVRKFVMCEFVRRNF